MKYHQTDLRLLSEVKARDSGPFWQETMVGDAGGQRVLVKRYDRAGNNGKGDLNVNEPFFICSILLLIYAFPFLEVATRHQDFEKSLVSDSLLGNFTYADSRILAIPICRSL